MAEMYKDQELYECDPIKFKECKKTGCFMNGGPCHLTTYKEYEKKTVSEVLDPLIEEVKEERSKKRESKKKAETKSD